MYVGYKYLYYLLSILCEHVAYHGYRKLLYLFSNYYHQTGILAIHLLVDYQYMQPPNVPHLSWEQQVLELLDLYPGNDTLYHLRVKPLLMASQLQSSVLYFLPLIYHKETRQRSEDLKQRQVPMEYVALPLLLV